MTNESNPWKVVSTREVYKNPWISLREDAVIRPDGKPGIYGVVEARAATGVIAITPELQVYLVGQYRYPVNVYSWEIIEGGAEIGELPFTAIKRELREEAGLVATEWRSLGPPVYLSNCFSTEESHFFCARGLTKVEASPEGTEVLTLRTVHLSECFRMNDEGVFTDAMTVIAFHRLRDLIRRGQFAGIDPKEAHVS
jgi:8-oxo-dGTP pyrophosphatase MutT (NUDIX family)